MSSLTPSQRNVLPPWLLDNDEVTIISTRVSSQRISPEIAKFTYKVVWKEPHNASQSNSTSQIVSSQSISSTGIETVAPSFTSKGAKSASSTSCGALESVSTDDISLMSRLSNRSAIWSEPNGCELIECKAVLIEKDINGSEVRIKLFAEHPATARLSEVVEALLTSAENYGKKAKVFVITVGKEKPLKLLKKEEMELKMVKDEERHRRNPCLVIDNTAM